MEGNLPSGNMMPGIGSYGGGIDLQQSMRVHQQQPHSHHRQGGTIVHPTVNENFTLSIGGMQDDDQPIYMAEYSKGEKGKNPTSDEDPSFTEETADGQNYGTRREISPWHRVKWTDTMVVLLITAVSYIGEDVSGARRKYAILQRKGKWKSISKVMAERGFFVSPQQCEDKFNDLNKRYKRLNEILGRGTSCEVVEKPSLLDVMDHVSEKGKEEVRRILSSKHLYYEQMCSYHNGNRLHLPSDPELQHSLRLALRSGDDNEKHPHDDVDEDDQDKEMEDFEERGDLRGIYGIPRASTKRVKQCQGHENVAFGDSLTFNSQPQSGHVDMNQVLPEGVEAKQLQNQWMKQKSMELVERKMQIEAQMLELEKERYNWEKFCMKKDRELEKMRMENQKMKLENDHMAFELKCREMRSRQ